MYTYQVEKIERLHWWYHSVYNVVQVGNLVNFEGWKESGSSVLKAIWYTRLLLIWRELEGGQIFSDSPSR